MEGDGKRYLLFGAPDHYPSGGIEDLLGEFESIIAAKDYAESKDEYDVDWAQIVVRNTLQLVLEGDRDGCDDGEKLWDWYKSESKGVVE